MSGWPSIAWWPASGSANTGAARPVAWNMALPISSVTIPNSERSSAKRHISAWR